MQSQASQSAIPAQKRHGHPNLTERSVKFSSYFGQPATRLAKLLLNPFPNPGFVHTQIATHPL